MRELRDWFYITILTFIFLIFGVDLKQDPVQITYFGVGMMCALALLAVVLGILQDRDDTRGDHHKSDVSEKDDSPYDA